MYGFLTNAFKRRLIYDFREIMTEHPEFKDTVQILPRFPLKDRPDTFVRIIGTTAALQRLSPNNHLGEIMSRVQLMNVQAKPGRAIEWAREEVLTEDIALVAPGLYYITVTDYDPQKESGHFSISPLYEYVQTLYTKYITSVSNANFQLMNFPLSGFVELIRGQEVGESIFMNEGEHFTINRATGQGTILEQIDQPGWGITARYWGIASTTGPYEFGVNKTNTTAMPGVVLAFGRRASVGDIQAVRVLQERGPVADALGGKWELSMQLEAWGKDPDMPNEVMDFFALMLWGRLFEQYTCEGIALTQFDIGGEAEEVYDDNTGQTWFMVNSSFAALTDWEIHVPKPINITALRGVTVPDFSTDGRSITPIFGRPILVSHSNQFERIR